jgi:hypothetical protein
MITNADQWLTAAGLASAIEDLKLVNGSNPGDHSTNGIRFPQRR